MIAKYLAAFLFFFLVKLVILDGMQHSIRAWMWKWTKHFLNSIGYVVVGCDERISNVKSTTMMVRIFDSNQITNQNQVNFWLWANCFRANWFVYYVLVINKMLKNHRKWMKCNEIKAKKLKQKSNKFCNGYGMAMVLVELILNQCKLQRKFFAHYS